MRPRSLYLILFSAGALVIGILLFARSRQRGPHRPENTVNALAAAQPAPSEGNSAIASTVQASLARLDAILVSRDARPNEATLTFKDDAAYRRFLARAQAQDLTIIDQLDALRSVRVRYDRIYALKRDLAQNAADYADAAANYFLRIPEKPAKATRADITEVPLRNNTLAFLGATGDRSNWGRGVTVAILDSGVSALDPTFTGRVRTLDVGAGSLPGTTGEAGHGTAVAALAAGLAVDAPGVAPAANLISIRVTGADGLSDIFTVAQGILAAVDAGAKVINISLGSYATTAVLTAAIDYAESHGALIVAAAGNDQATQLTWPAADTRVVSVGAVDGIGQQVSFSNSSPQLQISAPGYGVQTAWLDRQRVYVDGTSASAPIVAGAIAAVMSVNPGFTAAQAWEVLAATASDAGPPGADADYGRGILNLGWAMTYHDLTRVDPAISNHYYDTANSQMDFVVQNRGGQTVSGLTLDVDTNGFTLSYRVPTLTASASTVITVPVDQKTLIANGSLTYKTTLSTPIGINDQDASNNIKTSRLTPPKK
jgi:hypothetical protein